MSLYITKWAGAGVARETSSTVGFILFRAASRGGERTTQRPDNAAMVAKALLECRWLYC